MGDYFDRRNLNEFVAQMGIPRGPKSKAYLVDTENGDDDHYGRSWDKPLKTLAEAEDRCVEDRHDTVLFLARATADSVAAAIVWDKDYTHLIGVGSYLPGVGNRSRVVGDATVDPLQVITFSGTGSIVRNMQFNNESDLAQDSGAAVITANRCEFTNVYFAGMTSTTPGARAGAFSLKLTGAHENYFQDCTIGTDGALRASTNAELITEVGSSKNTFRRVKFMSQSKTAGKFLVHVLTSTTPQGINYYEDCSFYNNWENWGGELAYAFNVTGAQATYYIDIVNPRLVGVAKISNVNTHFYLQSAAAEANAGIRGTPTA